MPIVEGEEPNSIYDTYADLARGSQKPGQQAGVKGAAPLAGAQGRSPRTLNRKLFPKPKQIRNPIRIRSSICPSFQL